MRIAASILCFAAVFTGGCMAKPGKPPVVYNPVDVIASGRPPLFFMINRAGALNVIDVTTQSRVFHADMTAGVAIPMRLDADRRGLTFENSAATRPADKYEVLLPIDPTHEYAVEFNPDFKATPPATMPAKD